MTSFNCIVDSEGAQYSLVPLLELKEAYEYTIPVTIPSSVLRHYFRRSESSLPGVGISEKKNVLHKSPVFLLTPGLHSMLAPAKELPLAARCKPRPPPVLQWAAWRGSSDTLGCSAAGHLHGLSTQSMPCAGIFPGLEFQPRPQCRMYFRAFLSLW